jgi:translation initiation factor IF-3
MTTKQLQQKVSLIFSNYGHYKVNITFRGKEYKSTTTNMQAIDRVFDDNDGINNNSYYKTKKQAFMSLFNECKQANNLR